MSKIRFQAGVDVWLCGVCHEWQIVGRKCKCGRTNADFLIEKAKGKTETKEPKQRKRTRQPKSETEFTKSYFFKREKQDDK